MRHEPTEDDKTMLGFLDEAGFPFVCVLTKCDKLNKTEREKRRQAFAENPFLAPAKMVIEASAQNGEGMQALKEIIEKAVAEGFAEVEEAAEEAVEEAPVAPAPAVVKAVRKKI